MRLKQQAGWNQTTDDWRLFLSLRPQGCFVAVLNGQVTGTVTSIDYSGSFSWVGMVLVDRAYRRLGIGKALLNRAIQSLEKCESIRLDATPEGEKLYTHLGFIPEYELTRLCRPPAFFYTPEHLRDPRLISLSPELLAPVIDYDAGRFGRERAQVLSAWVQRNPHAAFVYMHGSTIRGYVMARTGSDADHIGPLVAENFKIAQKLTAASLASLYQRPVILDRFEHNEDWNHFLAENGFIVRRHFLRMRKGINRSPEKPGTHWAASGPELG